MSEQALRLSPPKRPERTVTLDAVGAIGDAARPLSLFERLAENTLVRRLVILVVLGALWQAYATWVANPLLFPTLTETLDALWEALVRGPLSSPHHLGVEGCLTVLEGLLADAVREAELEAPRVAEIAELLMAGVDFPAEEETLR